MVNVLPRVQKLREFALNLLFPQRCIECGKEGSFICASCMRNLPYLMPPVCPLCGRPQLSGLLCSGCISWQAAIDGIRSPLRFEGVVKKAVYGLKYHNLRAIAPMLAGLLNDYLQKYPIPGDVLVPVPLHKTRIRERGYNQSYLLAERLAVLSGIAVNNKTLVKIKSVSPQARTLNVEERKTNVIGAFSCLDNNLAGSNVILVDDVSTSGATLNACAGALKESGVKSVRGLTLAREI